MTDDELSALKASDFYGSDFGSTLRHMLSNLMRVCRGSGRSFKVTRDVLQAAGTLRNYVTTNRQDMPALEIESVLSISRLPDRSLSPERQRHEDAVDAILRGALQMAASRLVGDIVQEQRGWSELSSGIEDMVGVRPRRPSAT